MEFGMNEKRRKLLEEAVLRGKYEPLYSHLKTISEKEWETSFEEIETILGFPLPDSARIHRPWWANQGVKGNHSHALAWEMAGRKTASVDLNEETLSFVKL